MFNLDLVKVRRHPWAHVVKENFIDPEVYEELRRTFPECDPASGPTGYSIFWGDEKYTELIDKHPQWKALFEATQSQRLIDYCVDQFRDVSIAKGCKLDLEKVEFVSYCESREDKEYDGIDKPLHGMNSLFVRPDIAQAKVGYSRAAHLDHRRRFVTLLVYFCDSKEDARVGGDLTLLHRSKKGVIVPPQHNKMVAFACSNDSYHQVRPIVSQNAPRNFMQITTSSSLDIWPDASAAR